MDDHRIHRATKRVRMGEAACPASTGIARSKPCLSSNQLIPGVYDYVVFYLTGTNMFLQIFPDSSSSRPAQTKKLASKVSGLVFTLNNADYAQVSEVTTDLTLAESVGFQNRSITISSKSKLRNY